MRVFAALLAIGRHEVVIIVDRVARPPGGLHVELFDVGGSRGRAAVAAGR